MRIPDLSNASCDPEPVGISSTAFVLSAEVRCLQGTSLINGACYTVFNSPRDLDGPPEDVGGVAPLSMVSRQQCRFAVPLAAIAADHAQPAAGPHRAGQWQPGWIRAVPRACESSKQHHLLRQGGRLLLQQHAVGAGQGGGGRAQAVACHPGQDGERSSSQDVAVSEGVMG